MSPGGAAVRHLEAPLVRAFLFLFAIYVLGVTSVSFAPEGSKVAVWWPAAGVAVAMLICARGGWRWLLVLGVLVSAGLANYTAGRPLPVALGLGLSNAAEAALVVWWLTRNRSGRPGLRTLDDLWRFLVATLLGGLAIGLGAALTVHYGLDGPFLATARAVLASHAAAILVIAPLAMRVPHAEQSARSDEGVFQWLALLALVGYVFSPGQYLALAFLPLPLLVWASLRFGLRTVSWQLLTVGLISTVMTSQGWGPFAARGATRVMEPETTGFLVQAFLVVVALIALPLAVAVAQRRATLAELSASEELFRKTFSESIVGMLLLRESDGELRIAEVNDPAAAILADSTGALEGRAFAPLFEEEAKLRQTLHLLLKGRLTGWRGELVRDCPDRRQVDVALSPLSGDDERIFTAQVMDVTAIHETADRLRQEKDFTTAVLETTNSVILVVDMDGTVAGVNPATEAATGFTDSDLTGRPLWDRLIPAEDVAATRAMFTGPPGRGRRGDGVPATHEGDLLTRTGDRRRVVWTSGFLTDEAGTRTHVVMTGIDVTAERTARGWVRHVLEAASTTSIIGTQLDGTITLFNSGAEKMLGYAAEELVHICTPQVLHDAGEVAARAAELGRKPGFDVLVAHLEADDEPQARDWTLLHKDGHRITASLTVSAVRNTFGQRIGYLWVGLDVTAERRSEQALLASLEKEREAGERLRELDTAKTAFVSSVSHELRTPITSIVGYTEMLQDGLAGEVNPAQDRLLDAVRRNGERLIVLIEDLLTLSSIEAGSFTLERTTLDLRHVVRRAQEALRPLVLQRSLEVEFEVPADPVPVNGDPGQLERVLLNLMSNAVKFTEDGGRVTCRLAVADGRAALEVEDTGIGIPAEEQQQLFTRFFRSSTAQEREIQGTGLGLSIVQSIVHSHDGKITVRSEHLAGTTFCVTLPVDDRAVLPAATG